MNEVKMICPCCGKEIILEIKDNFIMSIIYKNKILSPATIKQLEDKNIEFGCLKGGEIN